MLGKTQRAHIGGLKGITVPTFDGILTNGHIAGEYSVHLWTKTSLLEAVKLAHLNNSINNKVREVTSCLTGRPRDYQDVEVLMKLWMPTYTA